MALYCSPVVISTSQHEVFLYFLEVYKVGHLCSGQITWTLVSSKLGTVFIICMPFVLSIALSTYKALQIFNCKEAPQGSKLSASHG